MDKTDRPRFTIKNKFQKGGTYRDYLDPAVLADICERLTGTQDYDVVWDETGYNKGRLLKLEHDSRLYYVSLSERQISSRNSSFQSFPSALSRYILEKNINKDISYYILPDTTGNFETDYFMFMYRLMKTIGVRLLNINEHVKQPIYVFSAPEDVIGAKEAMRLRNKRNKSTYITRGENGEVQVYAKTYGANKYESTLICLALIKLSPSAIQLFEVEEGGLTSLPQKSREAIRAFGEVTIASSTKAIEIDEFKQNNSLRSIKFIYNLLEKFEKKKCAFCECEVPQIIQGAHIWPVSSIKQDADLSLDKQLGFALDGHNGLWLCENHHKLFDSGLIYLTEAGSLSYLTAMTEVDVAFLKKTTTVTSLGDEILTAPFLTYLEKRNSTTVAADYSDF